MINKFWIPFPQYPINLKFLQTRFKLNNKKMSIINY